MSGKADEQSAARVCKCDHKASQHVKFFGVWRQCRYCACSAFELKPINPKRIALVRDFRMLDEEDWPNDMPLEKLWHFAIFTGFEIGFFRQDDPPEMEFSFCCNSYERWLQDGLEAPDEH